MFGWLYRRIATQVLAQIEAYLTSEENQQYLTELVDGAVDRQLQRLYGKVGGTMKGVNYAAEAEAPQIFKRDGSLNLKGLLGYLLQSGTLTNLGQTTQSINSPPPRLTYD